MEAGMKFKTHWNNFISKTQIFLFLAFLLWLHSRGQGRMVRGNRGHKDPKLVENSGGRPNRQRTDRLP